MNREYFEKRIVELSSARKIPHNRDILKDRHEYVFNNGNITIVVTPDEIEIKDRGVSYLFYKRQATVRVKENMNGFELKFDVVTQPGQVTKIKLFIVGGNKIKRCYHQTEDPLDILMCNEGEWFDLMELSFLSKVPRGGLNYRLDDPHVEHKTGYDTTTRKNTTYYRYVSGDSQKDSETTSELE